MKAIEVKERGGKFELVEKDVPEPSHGQVRIKVEACGVCHGESVLVEGHWPGIEYPRTPGHEVIGVVEKLGEGVTDFAVGQRVGVGWFGGHGHQVTGLTFDGGYAEYMVTPTEALAKIPEELSSLEGAPLLCAGNTTFETLRHSGAKPGDVVAIQGLGGLGHLAVQFANKMGFRTVAISRGKDKEQQAYELGAHLYIDTTAQDAAAELKKIGGARVIVATAPNSKAISSLLGGLAYEGKLLIVAGEGEPMLISPAQLLGGHISIQGYTAGDAKASEDTLHFSVQTGARPMIEVFPLEQAAEAYEKMMTSNVRFRAVLKIGK